MAAREEALGDLHTQVADTLKDLIASPDERVKVSAIQAAIRFLKDNQISAERNDEGLNALHQGLRDLAPTREELERLMRVSPDA